MYRSTRLHQQVRMSIYEREAKLINAESGASWMLGHHHRDYLWYLRRSCAQHFTLQDWTNNQDLYQVEIYRHYDDHHHAVSSHTAGPHRLVDVTSVEIKPDTRMHQGTATTSERTSENQEYSRARR